MPDPKALGSVLWGNVGKTFVDDIKALSEPILRSNRGIIGSVNHMRAGDGFGDALSKAYAAKNLGPEGRAALSDLKSISWGTVAGSYIGASSAYRIASGGGLIKDSSGNTNIIGIPLI